MHKCWLILLLCCTAFTLHAQQPDTTNNAFKLPIQMDEVVIKATRSGFDINAFIRRVQTDTTFYKAFKSLNVTSFNATNDIRVYDNEGNVTASLYSKTHQTAANGCKSTKVLQEKTTGNFYKRNGDYNYYTAGLYAYLFFTKGTACGQNDIVAGALDYRGSGQMEKSKYQLKQLIFNPGSKISGIPLMGDRASIFDPSEAKKYDFKILSDEYDGQPCYVFKVTPKQGEEHNVVFNELTTWFRKSDYSIVARDYSLSFNTLVYDFDVHMKVRTSQIGGKLLPTYINYDGNWHVFSKKRERVKFITQITY